MRADGVDSAAFVRSRSRRRWRSGAAIAAIVAGLGLRPIAALACVGDCNGDGVVAINELITGVDIALGQAGVDACTAMDMDGNGRVAINELVAAVNSALNECAGGPTITLTGSCAAPRHGSHDLKPCDAGTPITVFRCDDQSQCLHQQGLTMAGATTVADGGGWSVQIAPADASAALVFQANITNAVVYRTLGFGSVGGLLRAGLARNATFAPAAITPVTEAGVELLDMNGFENYSASGTQQVLGAVEQATADLSFESVTPDAAVTLALQTAEADSTVMSVLQSARNTSTPTASESPVSTGTATPTPTTPAGRFVDNGDGTITDAQTGLTWEKKVGLGSGPDAARLHDADNLYTWAGECSQATDVLCQPNAAAAAACVQWAGGGHMGCSTCPAAEGTCMVDPKGFGALTTIWDWVAQINAAGFANHDDWRVPTAAELESILDYAEVAPTTDTAFNRASCGAACADVSAPACSCTQSDGYWSANSDAGSPASAWFVWFLAGSTDNDTKVVQYYARAVRGGPAPPVPRFVDDGDGTITDRQTGLMWEKKVGLGAGAHAARLHDADNSYTWAGQCSQVPEMFCQPTAAAAAACALETQGDQTGCAVCQGAQGVCDVDPLNFGALTTIWAWVVQLNAVSFAGHADWRVPTQPELESIVDYTAAAPAVHMAFSGADCSAACGDLTSAACSCTQSYYYWSVTTDADVANSAWDVQFNDGLVDYGTKTDDLYVRAVRGGS